MFPPDPAVRSGEFRSIDALRCRCLSLPRIRPGAAGVAAARPRFRSEVQQNPSV